MFRDSVLEEEDEGEVEEDEEVTEVASVVYVDLTLSSTYIRHTHSVSLNSMAEVTNLIRDQEEEVEEAVAFKFYILSTFSLSSLTLFLVRFSFLYDVSFTGFFPFS